jgi:hypothetical protein
VPGPLVRPLGHCWPPVRAQNAHSVRAAAVGFRHPTANRTLTARRRALDRASCAHAITLMQLRPPAVRLTYARQDVRTHFGYGSNTADVEPANQDQVASAKFQASAAARLAGANPRPARVGNRAGHLAPEPSPSAPQELDRAGPAFRRMNVGAGRPSSR